MNEAKQAEPGMPSNTECTAISSVRNVRLRVPRLTATVTALGLFGLLPAAAFSAERPWTLQDSMAMRYVAPDTSNTLSTMIREDRQTALVPSPDGTALFFLVTGWD